MGYIDPGKMSSQELEVKPTLLAFLHCVSHSKAWPSTEGVRLQKTAPALVLLKVSQNKLYDS